MPHSSRDASALEFTLDVTRPGHEIGVRLVVPQPPPGQARFYLPSWAPGSYMVREFARHVERLGATQAGRELHVRKTAKDEWAVDGIEGGQPLEIEYGLYAHELTVRTSYLGPDRALVSGPATYLVPVGAERSRFRVRVVQPADWSPPECALPLRDGAFEAPDYDHLVDSPLAAGPSCAAEFDVRGVPHRLVAYGAGECDLDTLARDLRAACEATADVFEGDVPFERYLFIVEYGCSGGLEHRDSSVCGFPALATGSRIERRRRLALLIHEYFHAWNVKRIRPAGLGPFDYRREAYTPHLWVAEGLTSYYQNHLALRAKLLSPGRYLTLVAGSVLDLERTPGRFHQSLEESSHDAWIKFYRPHEGSRNSQVSYYGKGAVAGLVLDLEIRRRSRGARSLDDAFRRLWARWRSSPERGFTDAELREAMAHAAGQPIDDVVDECARGRGDLDVDRRLAMVGLQVDRRQRENGGGWLGVVAREKGGRLMLESVLRDGPAWTARISPGEELIALDGFRVGRSDARSWMDARRPGQEIVLTTALWGRLREVKVALAPQPPADYRIRKLSQPDAPARAACAAWLGVAWENLAPLDEKPEDERPSDGTLEL